MDLAADGQRFLKMVHKGQQDFRNRIVHGKRVKGRPRGSVSFPEKKCHFLTCSGTYVKGADHWPMTKFK